MSSTVTLLADHKGMTTPRVHGDEYFVDAKIEITNYEAGGVTITASQLGLSRINAVLVTGCEELTHTASAVLLTTGEYLTGTSFKLALNAGSAEQSGTADEGMVRVRVYGLL